MTSTPLDLPDDVTPIRRQYLEIKHQYPGTILFFRLGDFYETFDTDAETVARELEIVLTARSVGKGNSVPMAGVPHHAAESYLARLIERGYHVAICEQVGEQPVKGIFPRRVVRVVTPGTVVEPGLLPGDANNYLVCLLVQEGKAGLAVVEASTGEFLATEIDGGNPEGGSWPALRAELTRLHPREVLHPKGFVLWPGAPGHATPWDDWRFEPGRCRTRLLEHFGVSSLDGFGLRGRSLAERAAGAVLQYLNETQPAALKLLTSLRVYETGAFMQLDAATRRNLELTETLRGDLHGSLLGVLDHSLTPMGKRLMRQWVSQPLLEIEAIEARLDGVQALVTEGLRRAELRAALKPLGDLERLVNRAVAGTAQPRDLVGLRGTLERLPAILQIVTGGDGPVWQGFAGRIDPCAGALDLLHSALEEDPPATLQNTGVIRSGYSAELDGVLERSRHAREWIANLEAHERERTGIRTLKVGYNKVFGYYIELTRANSGSAPAEYIRKQTLVNAERYITPEMKEYETLVLNAEERIHDLETRLFRELCDQIGRQSVQILSTARTLAELDVLSALAETAAVNGYVRPQLHEGEGLDVRQGRHPVVEQSLRGERFTPNDIIFEPGERVRIITGPNMSGKSTYLRQAALICLMAQMGSFVPAESAGIGLVDRIFTRIGAQDEIHAGQSTFMVEMVETANILNNASARSLLVLDEVGRGTSTYDGLSIAWAVVEYIHNHPRLRARTLFATHYHELTQLADLLPGVRNYNVAVSEVDAQVVFLHRIVPGGADRSYGIHVAQLAGLPRPVIARASEIIQELERTSGRASRAERGDAQPARQLALFPETNPLLAELKDLDVNTLSPIEALNKLYEWQKRFNAKE